jgi:hypothetical protein
LGPLQLLLLLLLHLPVLMLLLLLLLLLLLSLLQVCLTAAGKGLVDAVPWLAAVRGMTWH